MLHLTPTLTANGDGSYSAVGDETLTSFSILFDFKLNPDPKVAGSFTLQNLSGTTQTFTVTATLGGLLPIAGSDHHERVLRRGDLHRPERQRRDPREPHSSTRRRSTAAA